MPKISKKRPIFDSLISSNVSYEALKNLYGKLKEHIDVIEKNKRNIPLCAFSLELSSLETIVKYLKENLKVELKEMSIILGRSVKTLWQAYSSSKRKYPYPLRADDFSLTIPILLFKDRRLSVLEHIVFYLKGKDMKFSDIARVLKRNPRTIWTIYQRAKIKGRKR